MIKFLEHPVGRVARLKAEARERGIYLHLLSPLLPVRFINVWRRSVLFKVVVLLSVPVALGFGLMFEQTFTEAITLTLSLLAGAAAGWFVIAYLAQGVALAVLMAYPVRVVISRRTVRAGLDEKHIVSGLVVTHESVGRTSIIRVSGGSDAGVVAFALNRATLAKRIVGIVVRLSERAGRAGNTQVPRPNLRP